MGGPAFMRVGMAPVQPFAPITLSAAEAFGSVNSSLATDGVNMLIAAAMAPLEKKDCD